MTGDPNVDTVALTRIDANTLNAVWKKGGMAVGQNRAVVSKDGKTMTVTTKGKNAQGQEVTHTVILNRQ